MPGLKTSDVQRAVKQELERLDTTIREALESSMASLEGHVKSKDELADKSINLICDYYHTKANKARLSNVNLRFIDRLQAHIP